MNNIGDLVYRLNNFLNSQDSIPDEPLFHYTSQDGLRGILKDRCLWLTEHRYLNDPSEIQHGKQVILDCIKECFQTCHSINYYSARLNGLVDESYIAFIASFCSKKDWLPAWRYYGGDGTGFAVGFKSEFFTRKISTGDPLEYFLYKILYKEQLFKEKIYETLRIFKMWQDKGNFNINSQECELYLEQLIRALLVQIPIIKNECFEQENEWRWCMIKLYDGEKHDPIPLENLLVHSQDNQKLPFFMKHVHSSVTRIKSSEFNFCDIDSIYVGPRLNFLEAKLWIEKMLKENKISANDFEKIKIKPSRCSYK